MVWIKVQGIASTNTNLTCCCSETQTDLLHYTITRCCTAVHQKLNPGSYQDIGFIAENEYAITYGANVIVNRAE